MASVRVRAADAKAVSVAAARIAQTDWGVPDLLLAAVSGVALETVVARRSKGRYERGANMTPDDPALKKDVELVDGELVVIQPPLEERAPDESDFIGLPAAELRKLNQNLILKTQREIAVLLGSGAVMELGQRHIGRIEQMIKSSDKLWKMIDERTESEPSETDEMAAILKRMEDRINDLAEERYQQLVAERLHTGTTAQGGTGVDVSWQA
jgi:hypothetical protein